MIRVGEKLLQKYGPRKPNILACILVMSGIMLMTLTFLPNTFYTIFVVIGLTLFGIGLGLYATPSTDTAVDNVPASKAGEAAGIYKISSTLGGSFGFAISVAVYSVVDGIASLEVAASAGLITNIIFAALALVAVIVTVPKGQVNKSTTSTDTKYERKAL